ncbi:SRPBCC family protein [Saccharomonospora sp. NB11]|jgi:hypothetical protein|uniref:SRPBCC family protein n=1 Tax=Saccharomonospora sp. NB11 TaxID=1642298 RepID=UPI0018D05BC4|nr:SRPBCC family protein [Saccharomonospora sp. NB11]
MSTTWYRFRTRWWLRADAPTVFAVLADLADYPRWWRDVRSVRQCDADTAELRARAVLPFTLALVLRRTEQDSRTGRLAVAIDGDLSGSLRAEVGPDGLGTRVEIVQEVEVRRRLLRVLSPWLRPVLRFNHAAMMRRGRQGLVTRLADDRTGHPRDAA